LRGPTKQLRIDRHNRIRSTQCNLVPRPVVELSRSWRLVASHLLGVLEPSVVLQVNSDASCPPGVTSDRDEKTREASFADRFGVSRSTLYRNTAGPESPKMLMMGSQTERHGHHPGVLACGLPEQGPQGTDLRVAGHTLKQVFRRNPIAIYARGVKGGFYLLNAEAFPRTQPP
jgi:hypothetical protein